MPLFGRYGGKSERGLTPDRVTGLLSPLTPTYAGLSPNRRGGAALPFRRLQVTVCNGEIAYYQLTHSRDWDSASQRRAAGQGRLARIVLNEVNPLEAADM